MNNRQIDNTDRQLLNIIQADFPIARRPYDSIAERLGITIDEAIKRVQTLVDDGIIRKLGASFDTRKLGHSSTLVAAKVPQNRLEEVAQIVSSFPEVTHNYSRDFEYNLWFTLVCENTQRVDDIIDDIRTQTGIEEMHKLPSERTFKIRVNFEF